MVELQHPEEPGSASARCLGEGQRRRGLWEMLQTGCGKFELSPQLQRRLPACCPTSRSIPLHLVF